MKLTKEKLLERRRDYERRYKEAHPDRVKESQRLYRERHPERRKEASRRFHERNPRKNWEYRIKRVYGITVEEFNAKLQAQDSKCALCLKTFVETPCIDHDHATLKNRDLLCRLCNRALGLFNEDPELLHRAAKYLEKHNSSIKEYQWLSIYART